MIKENTIYIRPLPIDDAEGNLKLQSENRDFFELFSMTRACDFYTIEVQRKRIEQYRQKLKKDQEYHYRKKPSVPGFFFTAQLQALFLSALVRNRVLNHLHFRLPH